MHKKNYITVIFMIAVLLFLDINSNAVEIGLSEKKSASLAIINELSNSISFNNQKLDAISIISSPKDNVILSTTDSSNQDIDFSIVDSEKHGKLVFDTGIADQYYPDKTIKFVVHIATKTRSNIQSLLDAAALSCGVFSMGRSIRSTRVEMNSQWNDSSTAFRRMQSYRSFFCARYSHEGLSFIEGEDGLYYNLPDFGLNNVDEPGDFYDFWNALTEIERAEFRGPLALKSIAAMMGYSGLSISLLVYGIVSEAKNQDTISFKLKPLPNGPRDIFKKLVSSSSQESVLINNQRFLFILSGYPLI